MTKATQPAVSKPLPPARQKKLSAALKRNMARRKAPKATPEKEKA